MATQIMYIKVYQDKNNMKSHYIMPSDGFFETMYDLLIQSTVELELPNVYEPVFMTEEEYNSLEEFKGF